MKKLFILVTTILFTLGLSACSAASNIDEDLSATTLNSSESLATLSYLSSGLLDMEISTDTSASNVTFLAGNGFTTEIETELDDVNKYIDQLKVFIEGGTDSFANITESDSDRPEYDSMITFTVNENTYVIYYSVDANDTVTGSAITAGVITGIIVINDVEYELEAVNTLQDKDEFKEESKTSEDEEVDTEDEVETEDDDDDAVPDGEEKMVLIARNGEDYIEVEYKIETDGEETEKKFYLESSIDGEFKEIQMKISQEDGGHKVTIIENDDKLMFIAGDDNEDGKTMYILNYDVNGVKGQVKIKVSVDDNGEEIYEYKIIEKGKNKDVQRGRPDRRSDDDDSEDETEDDSNNTNDGKPDDTPAGDNDQDAV